LSAVPKFNLQIFQRADVRLAACGLAAVGAVYIGFLGTEVSTAAALVTHGCYYVLLLTFALWVESLWRVWRQRPPGAGALPHRELALAAVLIALFSAMAISSESFQSKILYDEFVLQSTAYNMHYFRDTVTMVRGYDLQGVFLSLDNYLDKRPNFYAFLVSLVHDLTGYRTMNAYWLNAALYPVTLGLAYYLGRQLVARWGGFLAVALLGSLPLLGQNATGSGMELLNFAMILVVIALGGAYLRQPDHARLSALVLGAVLLAQSRYESAAYVAPVAGLILLGWWRERRVILSWPAIVAPLLLVAYALQNKVLNNTRWQWELRADQETRFSVEYLARNLEAAREFLLNTTVRFANSPVLTIAGFAALAVLAWLALRRRAEIRTLTPGSIALITVSLCAVANTILIMFYYWAGFNDPIAARFSLPLYLVLTFAVVAAGAQLVRRWPGTGILLALVAVLATVDATNRFAQPLYSHLGIDEIEWERRFVAARPPVPRLVITNKSTLPWLLEKTPSILNGRARLVADRVKYQLEEGGLGEILVMQTFRPATVDGDHQISPEDRLPGFQLELLAEKRFGSKITRISRLVAVTLPPAPAGPAPAVR
jgi:hypothetical protein